MNTKTKAKSKTEPKAAAKAAAKTPAKQAAKAAARPPESKSAPEKPSAKSEPAKKVAAAAPPTAKKHDFKLNDFIVYPAHGVGRIVSIEEREVAGTKLELFVVSFEKDKMTLRVPTEKAKNVGMRRLASPEIVQNALNTLKGRARIKRAMWSRRAQEYEAKINSGDLISIAEVVRDLHRITGQPEQSYSERQLYEAALDRMAREVAAVERIDEAAAIKRVETALQRAA
ncbi:MAG: CarD family transcriptional regulator [Alphaproteobacteria bacterium]|nr:CarD family transcriptional regulator [Alphaproteobacteria bacterium]